MREGMRIGELAARFGLNPKTIRFYEEIGLLPRAGRSASGYRCYDARDVERLGFIRRAKALDLSLDEIHDILSLQEEGSRPCTQVLNLIETKIRAIDRRMAELAAFRTDLATVQSLWANEDASTQRGTTFPSCICPIIEQQTEVEDHSPLVHEFERTQHH